MSEAKLSPEEEAEREDQKELMENRGKIESIMQLIKELNDREKAEELVNEWRVKVGDGNGKGDRVFHEHKGKRVTVTRHASEHLKLGEALELYIQTKEHGADLHRALERAAERRVALLDRVLKRGLGLLG
jgi:hypothetical protein